MSASLDSSEMSAAFGPDSPPITTLSKRLQALYRESASLSPVANSLASWANCRPQEGDNRSGTFIRHTCLSILYRLMAYRFLEPLPSERDLWNVINGDYFAGAGLGNFLGEDFFFWPFFRRSMGIGDDSKAMEAAGALLTALRPFDFTAPSPELPSIMYRAYHENGSADSEDASAEDIPELAGNPSLTCIAPRCGDGSGLALAVRSAAGGRLSGGERPLDALAGLTGQFLGMTPEPLAAVSASVAFLFALGEPVKDPHPPILIPVYLADAGRIPEERLEANGERSYAIEAVAGLALPERVATDPLYLDWLLGRLPNYQRGAALRLRAQPEDVAVQEVLIAWYNYLTSPKLRTPIPEPLTPAAADVMVEAARVLIVAYVHGSGPGPLHLARNAPAPLFASQREFELTI